MPLQTPLPFALQSSGFLPHSRSFLLAPFPQLARAVLSRGALKIVCPAKSRGRRGSGYPRSDAAALKRRFLNRTERHGSPHSHPERCGDENERRGSLRECVSAYGEQRGKAVFHKGGGICGQADELIAGFSFWPDFRSSLSAWNTRSSPCRPSWVRGRSGAPSGSAKQE